MRTRKEVNGIGGEAPTNGAEEQIGYGKPFVATVKIKGTCPLLFHRWNVEGVEAKGNAPKGSKAKKTDDIESYLYRNKDGEICIPGEYLRQSILGASKFKQDPRSPRKSAHDLYKAALVSLTELASLGIKEPDYIDKRRVGIQRNSVTRWRPAIEEGWECQIMLMVLLAEYISPAALHETMAQAGRLIGIADFRPTYGRFQILTFDIGLE